jgi:hypothetical protein
VDADFAAKGMIMINENAVSILYVVRATQILMKIKAAAVVILFLVAVSEASATGPATQPLDPRLSEINICARHMLDVSQAVYRYANARGGRLPASLGETFQYIRPYSEWTATSRPKGTPAERAARYLTPADAKAKTIPEDPTQQWIDENTSFVYIGDPAVSISDIRQADWGTTVIAHVKLDEGYTVQVNGKPTKVIPLVMLDGHEEAMMVGIAKQMIEESKKRFEDVKKGL